jgi:hypothetical protein
MWRHHLIVLAVMAAPTRQQNTAEHPADTTDAPTAPLTWAQRLKRMLEIDITLCPLCRGQLRVIADITDPELIGKILDHVQQRAPPRLPSRQAYDLRAISIDLYHLDEHCPLGRTIPYCWQHRKRPVVLPIPAIPANLPARTVENAR